MLGGMVHDRVSGGHQACGGSRIHDHSLRPLPDHLRDKDMHAVKVAHQIYFRDPVDILYRYLPDWSGYRNARIVHQHIHTPEFFHGQVKQCLYIFQSGDVGKLAYHLGTHRF